MENKRAPLFHIVKRGDISRGKALAIRVAAILLSFLVCGILFYLLADKSPIKFYSEMFSGAFSTSRRRWILLYKTAMLLLIAVAVTPAFKMKFWNIGAEGQTLISGLSCAAVMFYLGGKVPNGLLWIIMTVASILAGTVWALIPALFKAKWNTNETLFTLMMNYIATQLIIYALNIWVPSGSGTLAPMSDYALPEISNKWLLSIIVIALVTVCIHIYLRYSKHGYEISVVGESRNTAKYVGINVKKVILRTMMLSGALCGIAGLLLVGGMNHTIAASTAGGRGFTAIMVSWIAKFNPLVMVLSAFLIAFLEVGANQVCSTFKMNDSIADILTAVILFFVIGCEFFINYKIVFRHKKSEEIK